MAEPTVTVQINPIIRIRMRCEKEHKDPWLRRLYVVWAANPSLEDLEPSYMVAQTDQKGYLSPCFDDLDPWPNMTIPLFQDVTYWFYFVRYPDNSFARTLASELNEDSAAAEKKWGAARKVQVELRPSGTDKNNNPIQEGVISIPEDPACFLPRGSAFYGGWTLFRNMPGTGSNSVKADVQCTPLYGQVRRLQYHLGRMRYPIGTQRHPYSPDPWTKLNKKSADPLYPNEGVFDVCTWNAVLHFQRHARVGSALVLDPALSRTPTLAEGTFDPLPAAEDFPLEMAESQAYVSHIEAAVGVAKAPIPEGVDTVVEETTAAAIETWLKNNFRKPGKVLVNRGDGWNSWMQEDVSATIGAVNADLNRLGVAYGLQLNNGLRDTRMSVVKPEKGHIVNSIHKSGFAFDLIMNNGDYVHPNRNAPFHYVQDLSAAPSVRWVLWAEADATKVPAGPLEDYVEYTGSITPWVYDGNSFDGGTVGGPLAKPGILFLNLTKLADHYLLRRIGTNGMKWRRRPPATFTLDSADSFKGFLEQMLAELPSVGNAPTATMIVDGAAHLFSRFQDAGTYLTAWVAATAAVNPTPLVTIDPKTKEGERVLALLRGEAFSGRRINVVVAGAWAGGEGASGFPELDPEKPPPATSKGVLTLSAGVAFPADLTVTASPITSPAVIRAGSVIDVPGLGVPSFMEWWHLQYEPGYSGRQWWEILELIGWTPEGLLGQLGEKPIFGLYGMGYTPDKLYVDAG